MSLVYNRFGRLLFNPQLSRYKACYRGVSRTGLRGGGGPKVANLCKVTGVGGNKGIENRQMYTKKMSKSRIEDATKYQSVD